MSDYRVYHDKSGVISFASEGHKAGDILTYHGSRKASGKPAHPAYVVIRVDDVARIVHVEPHDEELAELEAKIRDRLPKETMTMFTAKFKVITKKEFEGGNIEVVMNATDKGDFTKYTPSGTLTFICTNPAVNEQIKPGKVFTMLFKDDEEIAAEQEAQTDSKG